MKRYQVQARVSYYVWSTDTEDVVASHTADTIDALGRPIGSRTIPRDWEFDTVVVEENKPDLSWCPARFRDAVLSRARFLVDDVANCAERGQRVYVKDAGGHWLTNGHFALLVGRRIPEQKKWPAKNIENVSTAWRESVRRTFAKPLVGRIKKESGWHPVTRVAGLGSAIVDRRYVRFLEAAIPDGRWRAPKAAADAQEPVHRVINGEIRGVVMPMRWDQSDVNWGVK